MTPNEALADMANILNCALEVAPQNLRSRLSRDAQAAFKVLDEMIQREKVESHQMNNGG